MLDSVPGLTPGDFVRAVKQLIDLLDQIAAAASHDATARQRSGQASQEAAPGEAASPDETMTREPERPATPRDRDVAATARAAIDAMRRGVVAYSMLTD